MYILGFKLTQSFVMNEKKLLDEYILLFGDEPPFPPLHIMKTLVDMKNTGTLDEKLDQIQSDLDSFGKKIEDVTGVNVSAKIVDFLERLSAGTANIQNEFAAKVEQEKRLPSWHKSNFEKSVSGV